MLDECGLVLIGQTAEIAPADKMLYALRDATATVESIPLISASIMSKKLAEGIDGLVLDVKTGDGAFMERLDDSRRSGRDDVRDRPRPGQADEGPDHPDGPAARPGRGQRGRGGRVRRVPPRATGPADLMDLSVELAAEMVLMGGRAGPLDEAAGICRRTIADGSALERFRRVVAAQGGDPRAIDDPSPLAAAAAAHRDHLVEQQAGSSRLGRPADRPGDDAPGRGPGPGRFEDRPGRRRHPPQEGRRPRRGRRSRSAPCWSTTKRGHEVAWP